MKRIAIDMDDVIADTLPAILRAYNAEFNELLTMEHLRGYDIADVLPLERRERILSYLVSFVTWR